MVAPQVVVLLSVTTAVVPIVANLAIGKLAGICLPIYPADDFVDRARGWQPSHDHQCVLQVAGCDDRSDIRGARMGADLSIPSGRSRNLEAWMWVKSAPPAVQAEAQIASGDAVWTFAEDVGWHV